jgi:hypothetical protein
MKPNNKKLALSRETLKRLKIQTKLKTGLSGGEGGGDLGDGGGGGDPGDGSLNLNDTSINGCGLTAACGGGGFSLK